MARSREIVVPQRGLEPPTPGLGNRCSVQLSYWGGNAADSSGSPRRVSTGASPLGPAKFRARPLARAKDLGYNFRTSRKKEAGFSTLPGISAT